MDARIIENGNDNSNHNCDENSDSKIGDNGMTLGVSGVDSCFYISILVRMKKNKEEKVKKMIVKLV